MNKCVRRTALLLLLCLLCGTLAGCSAFPALSAFFTPTGTQATVTTQPGGTDPTRPTGSIHMYYDERLEIVGSIISLDVESCTDELLVDVVAENTETGSVTLRAVGVGRGTLVLLRDGYEISLPLVVDPAPISCFLIIGGDDARGSSAAADHAVKAKDGMVYYTVGNSTVTEQNVQSYLPKSLSDEGIYAENGTRLVCPLNALSGSGSGNYASFASAFAYKWVEQTGERVWIINAAREGSHIGDWKPSAKGSNACYEPALTLFRAAGELLSEEVDAGHYTLGRVGYLFCQGENDSSMNATAYLSAMTELHTAMQDDLHITLKNGEKVSSSFGGMIATRAEKAQGPAAVRMNGPRAAQHYIANSADEAFADLYMLSNGIDYWYSDEAVASYFSVYDARKYAAFYGYAMPTGLASLIDANGRYTEAAYNQMGTEAAENLLYITGHRQNSGTPAITLVGTDGTTPIGGNLHTPYGINYFAAVPLVSPIRLAKQARVTLTLTYEGADTVENYFIQNAPFGKMLSLSLKQNGTETASISTALRYDLTFAFSSSLPLVNYVDGKYRFDGFVAPWTCGYASQDNGAYTRYSAIDSKNGWLYDGNNLWGGHGGVHASKNFQFGPVNDWDAAYAFAAPEAGTVSISFNGFATPQFDYLFGIFVNGKMVWPTAGASANNSAAFYTVTTSMTDKEMTELLKDFTCKIAKGDTVTFVCRRLNKQTAEGCLFPVIKYLDEPIAGETPEQ